MKKLIVLALALLSMNSMAALNEYTGSNNGAACIVKLDLSKRYVEMAICLWLLEKRKKWEVILFSKAESVLQKKK